MNVWVDRSALKAVIMKILVGIDGSKCSEAAVQTVLKWFGQTKSKVRVLHVMEPMAYSVPPQMSPGYAPEQEEQIKLAREMVDRVTQTLRSAGFKVESAVESGDSRETIIDQAAQWHADLIVIGAHGRKEIQQFLMGNVAEHVARHAGVSVLIVRNPS
jgi:nucleotide-binding universal stress UspA family protein